MWLGGGAREPSVDPRTWYSPSYTNKIDDLILDPSFVPTVSAMSKGSTLREYLMNEWSVESPFWRVDKEGGEESERVAAERKGKVVVGERGGRGEKS